MPNFKGAECETVKISSCSCTLAELRVLCLYSRLLVSWLYTDAVTGVAGIDGCQSKRMALKGIRGGWGRGVKGNPGCKLRSEFNEREKRLFLTPGHSLWVGAVPSLQRSQPGSEQPKLTAERCMQQNKTSTWSRQNHRKAGGPPWHLLSCSSDIHKEARVVLSFTFLFYYFFF